MRAATLRQTTLAPTRGAIPVIATILLAMPAWGFGTAPPQDLFAAVAAGDAAAVEALIEGDADLVQARDERGRTPLHIAVARGDRKIVEMLLARGADINAVAGEGARSQSVVDVAFMSERMSGGADLTRYLVDQGAAFNPDAILFGGRANRLDLALSTTNAPMVDFLVEAGAGVNESPYPIRPLAHGALKGDPEIVRALLDAGAAVDARGADGKAAITWAVERGHEPVVALLLDAGAEIELTDPESGMTLLHLAALGGHVAIVDLLLDHGVEADAADGQGHTAIYYAGKYGHGGVYARLTASGATEAPGLETRFGPSPYLEEEMADGEAAAWYLNNRGWAIKTRNHLLVFDAEEFSVTRPDQPSLANGFLTPEEIGKQKVVALYTAYHGEIGEPAYIHEIEGALGSVTYVHNAGDAWRGSEQTLYLSPHDATTVDDVGIVTVAVTESMTSLGYLVRVDGLVVYYAGFRVEDTAGFAAALRFLRQHTDRIDLAFLPLIEDGVQGSGAEMLLREFEPDAWFVLDPNRREHLFAGMSELVSSWGLETKVLAAAHAGDVFVYRKPPPGRAPEGR